MNDLLADETTQEWDLEEAEADEEPKPEPSHRQEPRDAFIAPEPMKVERNPLASPAEAKADPFAAADIANAASPDGEADKPAKRNKAYSLFSKVTGVAKAMQSDGGEAAKDKPTKTEPKIERPAETKVEATPISEPVAKPVAEPAARQSISETPSRPPQRSAPPKATQQPLSGLERDEASQKAEEDLLDIPAFLRRQAN